MPIVDIACAAIEDERRHRQSARIALEDYRGKAGEVEELQGQVRDLMCWVQRLEREIPKERLKGLLQAEQEEPGFRVRNAKRAKPKLRRQSMSETFEPKSFVRGDDPPMEEILASIRRFVKEDE
jgi:hypothetical protein